MISNSQTSNIQLVCEYLCKKVPVPPRDFSSAARLIVIRSFDVNKPGSEVENLKGGVAGGSILRGARIIVFLLIWTWTPHFSVEVVAVDY